MAYNLYKEEIREILAPATGIEIYHNYTLLHDDLMDHAERRRGRETVHKKWDENTAILSGDAMLILAYEYISSVPPTLLKTILSLFNRTSLEICEGQQMDMDFETRSDVSEEEYIEMIRLKTSVLLAASLKTGALLGEAPEKETELLYDFGIRLGLAFQLQDDFLDVYGNPELFGKNIGGDILCNKKTYPLIQALKRADAKQKKILEHWLNAPSFDPKEKIAAVVSIYNETGVKELCEQKMLQYHQQALSILEALSVEKERICELKKLVHQLFNRDI
jgi:geranylgeranyl diphosphate synthase type II